MPLYFAYGSNLDLVDWQAWCARHGVDPSGLVDTGLRGWLPDRVLRFDYRSPVRSGGCLDPLPRPGQLVAGALFAPDEATWRALDHKEGAPRRYRRVDAVALLEDGRTEPCVTYEATDACRTGFHVPADGYLAIVVRGRAAAGIRDEGQLAAAAIDQPPPPAVAGIFVYGSLRSDADQGHRIADAHPLSIEPATIHAELRDMGAWPAILPPERTGRPGPVQGELVRFADLAAVLPALDAYEGFSGWNAPDNLFRRTLVQARLRDGQTVRAWAWCLARAQDGPRIESGDWLRR
ncbi:MAG: hypothetical protein D6798_05190 [Deltaproteobacteria bacterium]|nr:MAG: hypothetical protein D6798_05190 [Deltaproteobacteria bacterium]